MLAVSVGAQDKGTTLEEVVARVNNDIITRSDLDRLLKRLTANERLRSAA